MSLKLNDLPHGRLARTRRSDNDAPRQPRRRARVMWQTIASAAVLAVLGVVGVLLAGGQAAARSALEDRFHTRIELTGQFAAEYAADVLRREASVAQRALRGANPTASEFERVVADFGFEAALLLDQDGRVLQVYPAKPALIGTTVTERYEHLRLAVAGSAAISDVVASAARAVPVVAFAAPYETAFGRRVLSGAFDASSTPLAAHLRNALPFAGGAVYLLDSAGSVVATNLPGSPTMRTLATIEPSLPAVGGGHYDEDGAARWATAAAVPNSKLRIVASVPESELYAPLAGTTVWLPWLVVLALTAASLYAVHTLFALHRSRENYLALARIDPLTGISNRRELGVLADLALEDGRRRGHPVAVLMLDLDRFKSINDRRGHESGDEVLRVVSARMRNALRLGDSLGRWGGEEFVAILPGTTAARRRHRHGERWLRGDHGGDCRSGHCTRRPGNVPRQALRGCDRPGPATARSRRTAGSEPGGWPTAFTAGPDAANDSGSFADGDHGFVADHDHSFAHAGVGLVEELRAIVRPAALTGVPGTASLRR